MKRKRRKRRRGSSLTTMIRAIVLEGTGILVLILLLALVSTQPDNALADSSNTPLMTKVRDWLRQTWSESETQMDQPRTTGDNESTDSIPRTYEQEFRQFSVRRAIGFEETPTGH